MAEVQPSVGAGGETVGMGDQQQTRAVAAALVKQKIENRVAGGFVKVAGRLIRQHQFGLVHQGTTNGDALLLPAGEVLGVLGEVVAQAEGVGKGIDLVGTWALSGKTGLPGRVCSAQR